MKKSLLTLLLFITALTIQAQGWDGTAATWTKGAGTEQDPYLIETPQHLAYLQEKVSGGESYEGKFFLLTSDLDMGRDTGKKFKPIGFYDQYIDSETNQVVDKSRYFLGTFDGGHHVISNVCINFIDPENSIGGTGLFACISQNAVVKKITIGDNSVVEGTHGTGAIVGCMTGGTVSQCLNKASFSSPSDGMGQGGIVGSIYNGTISECINEGTIDGLTNVGGIAGYVEGNSKVENCYNKGAISFSGFYAGGIVGYLAVSGSLTSSVSNSYSIGKVKTDYSGSAVIGTTDNGVTITNCYYTEMSEASDDNNGVNKKTVEEMKDAATVALLNGETKIWEADTHNINDGFPVLAWQNSVITAVQNTINTPTNLTLRYEDGNIIINAEKPALVKVFGTNGQKLMQQVVTNGTINWNLNGVYIVVATQGGQTRSLKIVR